jgi:histidinol-phosphate aminotransferase
MSIDHLIQPSVRDLPGGLVPFDTVERVAARLDLPEEFLCKLDANENAYGPSPKVAEALCGHAQWHLYPDASQLQARRGLAQYCGVDEAHILMTNGGDELIGLLCQLLLAPGDNVVECSPSFEMYGWYVRRFQGVLRSAWRQPERDYAISPEAILSQIDGRTKMILLCNPNNPTGTLMPMDQVVSLLGSGVIVFVDEAYYEFAGLTAVPLVANHDNLIVLRSMSKWAGLAGLRVGYAVGSQAIMEQMWKLKDPFNVNRAGQIATIASLTDVPYLLANVQKIVCERERLLQQLRQVSYLHAYPSAGNFTLTRILTGDARLLRAELERQGILARHFDKPGLPNALRFTVGTPEHTDRLMRALRDLDC